MASTTVHISALIQKWRDGENFTLTTGPQTYLAAAAQAGNTAHVKIILQHLDIRVRHQKMTEEERLNYINLQNEHAKTALYQAVFYNHPDCVELLMAHGAIADPLKDGCSYIYTAVATQKPQCLNALIKAYEAHAKKQYPDNPEAQKAFITEKLNTPHTRFHKTPLHLAASLGYGTSLKLLIQAGADMTKADVNGVTPLRAAVPHRSCLPLLIEQLPNHINLQDSRGETALFAACATNNAGAAQALLAAKADPRIARQDGETAFSIASKKNCVNVLPLLMQHEFTAQCSAQKAPPSGIVSFGGFTNGTGSEAYESKTTSHSFK